MDSIIDWLLDLCKDQMFELYGCLDFNMREFCFANGYWSWDNIVSPEGFVLDGIPVISFKDLQSACDVLGLDIDCMKY